MRIKTYLFFIVYISVHTLSQAQMAKHIAQLQGVPWDKDKLIVSLTDQEKMERLKLLPSGDSIQFINPSYDPEYDDSRFYPLDTAGLRFVDLNGDEKPDLLYTGRSGNMDLRDTKVYYFQNQQYVFYRTLKGRLINLQKDETGTIEAFTYWQPCCDSYTSRIEKHVFPPARKGEFVSSISVIGRLMGGIQAGSKDDEATGGGGAPYPFPINSSQLERGTIKHLDLVAFSTDFRGTSPYFRERNKEVRNLLRNRQPVHLLTMDVDVKVHIIAKEKIDGEDWFLVLTESINNVPKSLYEWSAGDGRQFVGWVKEVMTLEK